MIEWTITLTFTDGPAAERDKAAALLAKLSADLRVCPTLVSVDYDTEPAE